MKSVDRKLRVFLCHSSQDKPIVRELYQRLNAEGWIDPWLDEEKLLPGQDWDMEIEKAVEVADAVIVCLSNNSVTKSGYIQKELRKVLDIADEKPDGEVFVIPVRFDNCELPPRLKRKHCAEYSLKNNAVGYSRILQSLENKVKSLGIRIDKLKLQEESDEQTHKELGDKLLVQIMLENKQLEVAIQIIGLVGKTSNFNEVAKRVLEIVIASLSTEDRQVFGTLQRLDSETNELVNITGVGPHNRGENTRVSLGEGVTGQVAQTGKALLVPDLTDTDWKEVYTDVLAGDMRSELAVPLMRDDRLWGVVNVESPERNAFKESDQRLLEAIAVQMIIALRNAEERELLIRREELERELQVAREIQESITPSVLPVFNGFDIGAYTCPARAVGGDLFDFIPLNQDTLGILIGDVVDKGVPASIFMAITKGMVHAFATPDLSPKEVLLAVNRSLYEVNTADMFVTMIYGVLERNGTFTYAQGGQGSPLVLDKIGNKMQLPTKTGRALGLLPNSETNIYEHTITIPIGSIILLYTDGVIEVTNSNNEEFGLGRLNAVVQQNIGVGSQVLCNKIVESIEKFRSGYSQYDDITLVAIKAKEV